MTRILTLKDIPFDQIYEAFSDAFSDYDMPPLARDELWQMLERRGFNESLSFGAFESGRIVSFTFNGTGDYLGARTAYDTGTGTVKEFRGQGLARRIFVESIPYLQQAGIEQYLLEVLQHNDKAVALYESLGFKVTREFNYYRASMDEIRIQGSPGPGQRFKELVEPDTELLSSFHDFTPSWQNSFDAIQRRRNDFRVIGAFSGNEPVGYGVIDPSTGDLTQIAVKKDHRRKGIGTAIFSELISMSEKESVKIINTERYNEPMEQFLRSLGLNISGHQFEMIRQIP